MSTTLNVRSISALDARYFTFLTFLQEHSRFSQAPALDNSVANGLSGALSHDEPGLCTGSRATTPRTPRDCL